MNASEAKQKRFYTRGEEIFNYTTHIVGTVLGIAALVIGIVFASLHNDVYGVVAMIIYGLSIIILYASSSVYHLLKQGRAKKLFRVFDHCTIFLLIAGTYTPFCLITLRTEGAWGWIIFTVLWILAFIGMTLNAVNMHNKVVKRLSMTAYLAMGWCGVIAIVPLLRTLSTQALVLTLVGGIAYTVGAIFYVFGRRRAKFIHGVWHLFVLAGTILHFIAILFYVVL